MRVQLIDHNNGDTTEHDTVDAAKAEIESRTEHYKARQLYPHYTINELTPEGAGAPLVRVVAGKNIGTKDVGGKDGLHDVQKLHDAYASLQQRVDNMESDNAKFRQETAATIAELKEQLQSVADASSKKK